MAAWMGSREAFAGRGHAGVWSARTSDDGPRRSCTQPAACMAASEGAAQVHVLRWWQQAQRLRASPDSTQQEKWGEKWGAQAC